MPNYYGRFRHICTFNNDPELVQEDLMGFFNVDSAKGHIKKQIVDQFEEVFRGEFGKYGRSYVLRDFGKVVDGRGRLVQEEVYLEGELERLAEKAFD
jgi:hypothetical protein